MERGKNRKKQAESRLRADTGLLIGKHRKRSKPGLGNTDEAEEAEGEASEMRIWSLGGRPGPVGRLIRMQVGDCNQEGR